MEYKVKFKSFWTYDDNILLEKYNFLTKTNDYSWDNIKLIKDNDYDFLVVQGSTDDQIDNFSKVIVLQYEPSKYREEFYKPIYLKDNGFYKFVDINTYFPIDHWNIEANYQDLLNINCETKKDRVSGLFSGEIGLPGHLKRVNFIQNFLDKTNWYDSYLTKNYHRLKICDNIKSLKTFKGILDKNITPYSEYKYIFAAENCYEKNYFTEKILRGILCECLVFYAGCPNIFDFIDPTCCIKLDLNYPRDCLDLIQHYIYNNEWKNRLPYIREQKRLLMNENNPLNIIKNIIEKGEIKWETIRKM